MADPWIKMRVTLWDDPRVLRIASTLFPQSCGIFAERLRIVGALYRTWALADTYTVDGKLIGYTSAGLDSAIGLEGWSEALAEVGWLKIDSKGVSVPRFTEHNGKSAKRRAEDLKRKGAPSKTFHNAAEFLRKDCGTDQSQNRSESEVEADHKHLIQRNAREEKFDVSQFAESITKRLAYEGSDGGLIWRVAWLVSNGDVSEHAARDAAESVANANQPIANRVGYFRATLEDNLGSGGATALSKMLARTPAPPRKALP